MRKDLLSKQHSKIDCKSSCNEKKLPIEEKCLKSNNFLLLTISTIPFTKMRKSRGLR